MEKKDDENPDYTPLPEGADDTAADSGQGHEGSDSPAPADPADQGTSPDTTGSGNEGAAGENEDGGNSEGGEGGEKGNGESGNPGSLNSDDPDDSTDTDNADKSKDSGPAPFEDRFLNSGASGQQLKRESLAVSLLRMALALLTGEVPEEHFIPLMDAVIAREEILKARAEGEIAGRNAIIEEQLVAPPVGAPDLNGTPIARSRRQASSIFDLASLAR